MRVFGNSPNYTRTSCIGSYSQPRKTRQLLPERFEVTLFKNNKTGMKKNKYKSVTDEHLPHFNISKAMYSGETPAGFIRDPSLCSAQSCAFRHTATGNIFIGWRGTELNRGFGTAVDDLVTDGSKILKTSLRRSRQSIQKLPFI